MSKNHDIIEIAGELRHETDKAYLLFDGDKEVWIAKKPWRVGRTLKDNANARIAGSQQGPNMSHCGLNYLHAATDSGV